MNDWQYLSLGDLEQNKLSPKVNLEVLLSQRLNMEIGQLVGNRWEIGEYGGEFTLKEDKHA